MADQPLERRLVVSSHLAEGYQLTEDGRKHMQHVFTVWFPRRVFHDLTPDTVRVDVLVKRGYATGKSVYISSFLRADGSVIRSEIYDDDRLVGAACQNFDQLRSGYCGKKDGLDYRMVIYTSTSTTGGRR